MAQISAVSVILPSYNPTEQILTVIRDVISQGFADIIVINDGSGDESFPVFDAVDELSGCTVLTHDVNRGKGAALKTGMAYYLENRPDGIGVVTIDDDGQHLPEDIRLCAEALCEKDAFVLGVRDFSSPEVPSKSRIGNKLAASAFRVGIGLDISDTQTGLRAIPGNYIETLLYIDGSRFEYETNVLVAAKKHSFRIAEVPIHTVYLDGNKGTHYRPLADSFMIFLQFAKYSLGSLISFGIDLLGFYLLLKLLGGHLPEWAAIFLCTLTARAVSSVFNFFFNKNVVFKRKGINAHRAVLRYILLCCAVLVLSSQLVALISRLATVVLPLAVTLIKIAVDAVLFAANYFIQKKWVYK
jgi:glycosyltransferase involved in cell wall biosynthesis